MLNKNVEDIISSLKDCHYLVASKYFTVEEIRKLYQLGIRDFGENRCQSFLEKYQELKDLDITWHFIGHLQTNKVSSMINKIAYLHSLDSFHLASYVEKYRIEPLDVFIQIKLTDSCEKSGIKEEEVIPFLEKIKDFKTINVIGLMGMVDYQMSEEEKYSCYQKLTKLKTNLNELGYENIKEISAGMSNDYKIAINAGATILRLGSIFKSEV